MGSAKPFVHCGLSESALADRAGPCAVVCVNDVGLKAKFAMRAQAHELEVLSGRRHGGFT